MLIAADMALAGSSWAVLMSSISLCFCCVLYIVDNIIVENPCWHLCIETSLLNTLVEEGRTEHGSVIIQAPAGA